MPALFHISLVFICLSNFIGAHGHVNLPAKKREPPSRSAHLHTRENPQDCREVLDINQCIMRATFSKERNTGGIHSPSPETLALDDHPQSR